MIEDKNKTALTKKVTQAVIGYLDARGCKPIETEVCVSEGWVADVASVVCPTLTELTLLKLIKRKPRWDRPGVNEWYERARKMQRLITVLVEVKSSMTDFSGDRKWALAPPTDLAYIALPKALPISEQKIPAGWGLLSYSDDSGCVRLTRAPSLRQASVEQQLCVVHSIAVQRDHSTRYERMREFQRFIRERRNEETSLTRVRTAISAIKAIVQGRHGSVAEALQYYGIKQIPNYLLPELDKLWAIHPAGADEPAGA